MRLHLAFAALGLAALTASPSLAASLTAPMALTTPQGTGAGVGQITFRDGVGGILIDLDLHGLPPGAHGLHVHLNASCAPTTAADGTVTLAGGAGPHLDPGKTGKHAGPMGGGHMGDLPAADVGADGKAHTTLPAPQIASVSDLKGHAVVLHAGGDNYSDQPAANGGGGGRLACGVLQ
ncbi:MAG TPA: superoxide dismutase family protein [Caulobacteraceae bacterium]|jgi:Cu-Zn family superoxide dismutase|nr:superoxide dismutase family protein [Caulobacteraceae bacterium]